MIYQWTNSELTFENLQSSLQENISLTTNFSDQKLLITIVTNLDI